HDRADAEQALPRALARSVFRFAAADGGAGHCRHHDPVDVQRSIRCRERGARGPRHCAYFLADAALDDVLGDSANRRVAMDAVVRADPTRRPTKPSYRAVRGSTHRCGEHLAYVPLHHAANAPPGHGGLHRDPLDRCIPHVRHRVDGYRRRVGARHRGVQRLRLRGGVPVPYPRPRLCGCRDRGDHHRDLRAVALPHPQSLRRGVEVRDIAVSPARASGFFSALAPRGKTVFSALAAIAVCLLFAFPVFWLVLTSLRPGTGVYYVHRGTEFTIDNFHEVLSQEIVVRALFNSFMISTLATVLSLGVTATSGYMLSRFKGPIPNTWFSLIYIFRCVPYVAWVLPLYFVTQQFHIFDSYWGLLLPHIAVHICFFSWIMKGFFDGIDPSMEYAAMIDGCSRWGAFWRVAMPAAV